MNEFKTCQYLQLQGWGQGRGPGLDAHNAVQRGSRQLEEPLGCREGAWGRWPRGTGPSGLRVPVRRHTATGRPRQAPPRFSDPHGLPTSHWPCSDEGLCPADPSRTPSLCSNITHHGAPSSPLPTRTQAWGHTCHQRLAAPGTQHPLPRALTLLAVLPAEAERALTQVRVPAADTGAPVLTPGPIAEVPLSSAAWKQRAWRGLRVGNRSRA